MVLRIWNDFFKKMILGLKDGLKQDIRSGKGPPLPTPTSVRIGHTPPSPSKADVLCGWSLSLTRLTSPSRWWLVQSARCLELGSWDTNALLSLRRGSPLELHEYRIRIVRMWTDENFGKYGLARHLHSGTCLTATVTLYSKVTSNLECIRLVYVRSRLPVFAMTCEKPQPIQNTGPEAGQYFNVPWQSFPAIFWRIGLLLTYTRMTNQPRNYKKI